MSEIINSLNSVKIVADFVLNNFLKNIFVNSWPPWKHFTFPKTLWPDSKKSPAKSKILWFTNSFSFLRPFSFKTFSSSTTMALLRDPPFANPFFLIFSISWNKQNVLDKYTSSSLSVKKLIY